MIEGHGLAPVGHGKIRVGLLGNPEKLGGIFVLKIVQLRQSLKECALGGGRAGICEGNFAEFILRAGGSRPTENQPSDENAKKANPIFHDYSDESRRFDGTLAGVFWFLNEVIVSPGGIITPAICRMDSPAAMATPNTGEFMLDWRFTVQSEVG
jgi:hypothetical protein